MPEPIRILAIRMDAIGDTLLSLPALHVLRQCYPDAHLTVLASAAGAAVLQDDPTLSEIVVPPGIQGYQPPAAEIALSFTEKPWAYRWMAASGAERRIGFWPGRTQPLKSLQIQGLLTDRVALPNTPRIDPGLNEVERYMKLLQPLGIEEDVPPIRMFVPAAAHQAVEAWLKQEGIEGYTAVHLSKKWLRGGWRISFLQKLLDALPDGLLVYGPAERAWAGQLQGRSFFDPDLKRYAALLSRARALVTMDTSAAHLAAAVGTPVVDVFGPQHFAHNTTRWRPWKVPCMIVQKQEASRSQGQVDARTEDALVEEITGALGRLLV